MEQAIRVALCEASPEVAPIVWKRVEMPRKIFLLRLLCDAGALGALTLVAAAAGLMCNLARAHPLPLRYVSKENRLALAVQRSASPAAGEPPVTASASTPRMIDLQEFQRFTDQRTGPVLDARSEAFYRLGHIPGALNLSRETFEKDYAVLQTTLATHKDEAIAVYCSSSDCPDAGLVAEALLKLGYRTLLIYPEGWEQWTQAGLPQEPPAKE